MPPPDHKAGSHHTGRRFVARKLDLLFTACAMLPFVISTRSHVESSATPGTINLFALVSIAALVNAGSIATFGTTLGKYMTGIRILSLDRGRLSFTKALTREGIIYVLVYAGGVALLSLIGLVATYIFLRKTHSTPWDKHTLPTLEFTQFSPARFLGVGAITLCLLGLWNTLITVLLPT